MEKYTEQANVFAKKNNVKLEVIDHDFGKYFPDDEQGRDIYTMRLKRNGKQYTFKFGQSISNAGKEPTMYDVLATITKYDEGDFEDFCGEFGYSTDSRTAERVYKAVCKEYAAVQRLFGDVMEQLQEIQ